MEWACGMSRTKFLQIALKVFGIVLAVFAINKVIEHSGADIVAEFQRGNKALLLVALALFGVGPLLSSIRWGILLKVQGIELDFKDLFRLTMIGNFWNLAMPGGVGGDLLKMVYVRKHARDHHAEAIMTILVDRVIGLLGLFMVALVAVFFSWNFLSHASSAVWATVTGVACVSAGGAVAVTLTLAHRQIRMIPGVEPLVDWFKRICPPVARIISRVVNGLDLFKNDLSSVGLALAISMVIHSSVGLAVMLIGWAVGSQGLEWKDYFLATQVANTISAIPLTPGGLGSRDAVLMLFFKAVAGDASKPGVIPIFQTAIIIFWSMVGGLFFLFEPKQEHAEVEELVEDYLEQGETALELETPTHA